MVDIEGASIGHVSEVISRARKAFSDYMENRYSRIEQGKWIESIQIRELMAMADVSNSEGKSLDYMELKDFRALQKNGETLPGYSSKSTTEESSFSKEAKSQILSTRDEWIARSREVTKAKRAKLTPEIRFRQDNASLISDSAEAQLQWLKEHVGQTPEEEMNEVEYRTVVGKLLFKGIELAREKADNPSSEEDELRKLELALNIHKSVLDDMEIKKERRKYRRSKGVSDIEARIAALTDLLSASGVSSLECTAIVTWYSPDSST